MRPIGWTLACALLAATFPKRAILPGVQSVGVATASSYQREAGRANVTKSLPIISKDASVDPDIQELSRFIDDTLVGGWDEVRGKLGILSFGLSKLLLSNIIDGQIKR